jgi:pyrimidine-nucleoside phosphorylase
MSGRGLGFSGGTLDKLESIPGFRTDLLLAQATAQIEAIGCVLIGQTREIAPADRKLYALRDATARLERLEAHEGIVNRGRQSQTSTPS